MLPPPSLPTKVRRSRRGTGNASDWADEIHAAMHAEHRLHIEYNDRKGSPTRRVIWPVDVYSPDEPDAMVLAWCETRRDFRNFRTDRIHSLETLDGYPVRRRLLLARWSLTQEDEFY